MPLQAVTPQRLYRQISEQIHALIANGEFGPGERLPAERDLARQLGVSRPSLREALIALEVEGAIEVRTGSGIYVMGAGPRRPPRARAGVAPEWGPLQLMRAREVVEGEVAALAARHAGKAALHDIAAALDEMRAEAAAGRSPRLADEAFHNAIAAASGNEVLRDTVQGYEQARYAPIFTRLGGYFETRASWNAAIREHAAVLQAIGSRDPDAARLTMREHLRKARSRYTVNWNRAMAIEPAPLHARGGPSPGNHRRGDDR